MSPSSAPPTGAHLIAQTLRSLDVAIVFGIVGIPIIEVAEACVAIGIRFVGFRNEQAASYAASAYGFLTGKPGVLLVVGGPGVVHALAGIHGAQQNHFPLLALSGASSSTHLPTRGSFQTLQTTTFLAPHTKLALRAPTPSHLPQCIREAYRAAFWGRPGAAAVEINGDYVTYKLGKEELGLLVDKNGELAVTPVPEGPRPEGDKERVKDLAKLLMNGARKPLIVVGKGAAYSRCEDILHGFIERTSIPFLPTPMGKGLLPDGHPLDVSAARSTALSSADLIILLGARLNWILHFGAPPKFSPSVQIAKIDLSAEELGRNLGIPGLDRQHSGGMGEELGIVGDCGAVLTQLAEELDAAGWEGLSPRNHSGYEKQAPKWLLELSSARDLSTKKLAPKLHTPTPRGAKLSYHRTFHILHMVFAEMAAKTYGGESGGNVSDNLVYVSEGANTMDISRSIFTITRPRQRLDAGTDATMGIGLGYAIAAWCAYNLPQAEENTSALPSNSTKSKVEEEHRQGETMVLGRMPRKKIIAIEGDSAVGFSAMEIETMARYHMDIIIVVVNNGGVYRGVNYSPKSRHSRPSSSSFSDSTDPFPAETATWKADPRRHTMTLPSTALSYHTRYSVLAEALGAWGIEVWGAGDGSNGLSLKTHDSQGGENAAGAAGVEAKLVNAIREAWLWSEGAEGRNGGKRGPVVVDVGIESGKGGELVFAWLGGRREREGVRERSCKGGQTISLCAIHTSTLALEDVYGRCTLGITERQSH
ncbi:thiamine pyrophosphate enzyme, N-terminal TPP binding domain-containing protein [Kalaharituber pfeilii]|nr:thiamine pyrophosphate enzyme, N-terminal TPP binding domain-containing protein [Kalaharituber pfeilii]